jgi:hypothetical protein
LHGSKLGRGAVSGDDISISAVKVGHVSLGYIIKEYSTKRISIVFIE